MVLRSERNEVDRSEGIGEGIFEERGETLRGTM